MSYRKLFFLLLLFIVIFLAHGFWELFAFPDASWPLQKGSRVTLLPGHAISQSFVSTRDGLRRIGVLIGEFTLTGGDQILLELRDSSCTSVLDQEILSHQSFDTEYPHTFVFRRQADSANQTYCFTASFTTDQPIKKSKAPRLYMDKEVTATPYSVTDPGGRIATGTKPLAVRPGYTNTSLFTNTHELFDRMSQYKPFFLKTWPLLLCASFGILLTLLTFILLIWGEKEK